MATRAATTIERSVRAFEDELRQQIERFGVIPDDPEALGRRAARTVASGAAWAAEVGPFYDTSGAQAALDGVTKQAVSQRVNGRRLLALRLAPDGTGRDRLVYPVWQFVPSVLRHLPSILAAAGYDPDRATSGWTIATWLTTPDPALSSRSPLELMRADIVQPVLALAVDVALSLGVGERAAAQQLR
jgi:Protein of unknown function (DUF2384)